MPQVQASLLLPWSWLHCGQEQPLLSQPSKGQPWSLGKPLSPFSCYLLCVLALIIRASNKRHYVTRYLCFTEYDLNVSKRMHIGLQTMATMQFYKQPRLQPGYKHLTGLRSTRCSVWNYYIICHNKLLRQKYKLVLYIVTPII